MSVDRPTDVDVLEQQKLSTLVKARTLIPGVVVAYDSTTRKCKIQPLRMGLRPDGIPYALPIVPQSPVLWPRFAGMIIVGRLNPGDTVMLAVSDRELSPFLASTVPAKPFLQQSKRCHTLTDAVVVLGLSQDTNPVKPAPNPGVLHVGREDLQAFIQIGIDVPTTVLQGKAVGGIKFGPAAVEGVLRGTAIAAASDVSTPATLAFVLAALPAAAGPDALTITGIRVALQGLFALLFAALSTKVLTE